MSELEPVRKSIVVACSREHAFKTYTEALDSWWPRRHHSPARMCGVATPRQP